MRYEIPSFSTTLEEEQTIDDEPLRRRIFVSLAEFFYPLYHVVSVKRPEIHDWVDQKLREAHMNRSTETYVSGSLAIGTLLGSLLGLILVSMVYSAISTGAIDLGPVQYNWFPGPVQTLIRQLPEPVIYFFSLLKVPTILAVTGLIGGAIGMCTAGGIAILVPTLKAKSRAQEIQMVFPDAVAMMYSLSEGGADQITIFQKIADAEDAFGELSVEFQRIVREAELFHEDYQTAIQKIREETPNEELERALSDMLGVLNSGGSFEDYLHQESERQREQRKREHEARVGVLETLGSTYTAVLMGPIMAVIMLVVMALIGSPMLYLLGAVVYLGEPLMNLVYGIIISMIKADQPGDGLLEIDGETPNTKASRLSIGPAAEYSDKGPMFSQVWRAEAKNRVETILKNPFAFFRDEPDYTLVISVPLALLGVGLLIATGYIYPSIHLFTANPVRQTLGFFFVPFYIILIPYTAMYEWGERRTRAITQTLDKDLRKLANTNQAGQPFHESLRITARDKDSLLAAELGNVYKKLVNTGIPINRGLVEMNNKYARPRLARTVKIIEKAQDVSSDITAVLKTAATSAQIQRDLNDEQAKKMFMLVMVVEISFFVFLVILAGMKLQMIDTLTRIIGQNPSWPNFESVNPDLLSLMFFHAALIQGVCSGMVAGYLQRSKPRAGLKFALLNGTIALIAWLLILSA